MQGYTICITHGGLLGTHVLGDFTKKQKWSVRSMTYSGFSGLTRFGTKHHVHRVFLPRLTRFPGE